MARKTKEEAQITRDRILDAAEKVFYEKGVSAARLEDIAGEAGVTRGALYWHFANKLAIFTAMHARTHCEHHSAFLASIGEDGKNPSADALEDFCASFLIDLEKDERLQRIFSIMTLKCDYSGEMEAFLTDDNVRREEALATFAEAFKKMKQTGKIGKDTDVRLASLSFFCYLTGIVTAYLQNPSLFDFKKQAHPLVRQFLNGLNG